MKKAFLLVFGLLLIGSIAFAQRSDDDFEDVGGDMEMEAFLGFQFGIGYDIDESASK